MNSGKHIIGKACDGTVRVSFYHRLHGKFSHQAGYRKRAYIVFEQTIQRYFPARFGKNVHPDYSPDNGKNSLAARRIKYDRSGRRFAYYQFIPDQFPVAGSKKLVQRKIVVVAHSTIVTENGRTGKQIDTQNGEEVI